MSSDLADLERGRHDWEQLLERSGGQHVSPAPTWMITWWRVLGPEGGRRLLLPLVARRTRHRGIVPMDRIELVASGEDADSSRADRRDERDGWFA